MLVTDLVDPQDLVGYIRGLAFEQLRYKFLLSQFLPWKEIQDTEFRVTRGNLLDVDSAVYRGFDTESPIAKRQAGTRVTGQIPPLSLKIRIGEEERLRIEAQKTGDQGELIAQVYDDAGNLTRAILARIERAIGEALHSGHLVLSENGVTADIDYGRANSHSVAPGTLWSDPAADVIGDLTTWVLAYLATNGIKPDAAIISTSILSNLLKNTTIRTQAASLLGTPARVSVGQLSAVLSDFELPPLIVNDEQTRVGGTVTRIIPANKLVFVPPPDEPLGNTLVGITAESLELVDAGYLMSNEAPGLVSVVLKEFDPVSRWTKVGGLALPVLANPNLTFTATVL